MTLSRRTLFRVTAGGLLLAGCAAGGANTETESSAGTLLRSTANLPEPFTVPLPVPPVLEPVRTDATTDYYEITQRAAPVEILPGLRTTVWGYDGVFPGPTLESRRGRTTVVRQRNELGVPVAVHLHGGRTPPEHDGYPLDLVAPGAAREYVYPLDQPAATLWYHDHRADFTGPQVYRGLAGFHLHRDDEEDALPLPRGEREVPLMIADRSFAEDGSFAYPSTDPSLLGHPGVTRDFVSGVLGDCVLVNGAPWPVLEVAAARYRFRILNASNARRYRLALDPPGPGFVQIGSDQGLLAAPVAHDQLQIAQAERFDVVVDFSGYPPGEEVTLVNRLGEDGTARVMRFVVTHRAADDSAVPTRLADVRPLSRADAVAEREFTFRRGGAEQHGMTLWTVNGEPFGAGSVAAEPTLGSVELWRFRAQNVPHPVHVHLAPFQVLGAGRYTRGWKDTVDLASGDQAEVLVHFDGYRGKYVLHCHNLEHEDMMMMANFRVR
ncbi:multicopper oxidase family protein [Amycolatopsis thermophila]|uniref:Spore coat protein A n=1 Tax=Amycolatopsis thermophila TaxID=206084 RepID=A0ABU0EQM4_9PSEU|nr:multicopper oxidase domain-containing protein [Amycolatopsis thermophila]MDQ0377599.1 spore coat protein A [Amycolatopsis thermophila]